MFYLDSFGGSMGLLTVTVGVSLTLFPAIGNPFPPTALPGPALPDPGVVVGVI